MQNKRKVFIYKRAVQLQDTRAFLHLRERYYRECVAHFQAFIFPRFHLSSQLGFTFPS